MNDIWTHIVADFSNLGSPSALAAFGQVVLIDIMLAADNAIVVGALAAGLPIVSTDVGDVARMVSADNAPFVTGKDAVLLRDALQPLVLDPALRARVGAANRAKALAEFDEGVMIARYRALYADAMRRPGVLG